MSVPEKMAKERNAEVNAARDELTTPMADRLCAILTNSPTEEQK